MENIKIFISSPGDLVPERTISKRVVRKLQGEFGKSINIQLFLWEDLPLQTTRSFQDGINAIASPEGIDIAVFMIWSRLGSPLGEKYKKEDGSLYLSGTEYEYEMMLSANKRTNGQKPSILAYIKTTEEEIPSQIKNDTAKIKQWIEQKDAVQNFIKKNFYDQSTNTIHGAYHQFDTSSVFEQKLTEHLRHLIIDRVGNVERIEWVGNPYLGLKSFDIADESIYFGRKRIINEIEEILIHKSTLGAPSLFILGASGAGKSSLIKAGLLPDLFESGIMSKAKWHYISFSPSQFGGKIYSEIVRNIEDILPALKNSSVWNDLSNGIRVDFKYIKDAIVNAKLSSEQTNTAKNNEISILVYIDQFEELFTDSLFSEEDRIAIIEFLYTLVKSKQIWFLFSIRSDFYQKFAEYPLLLEIKKDCVLFDLPNLLSSDIPEIIEEPARKAGLKWEIDKNGTFLNKVIINDVSEYITNLPLIEFALYQLYEKKDENNVLTFKAYNDIGKINGAIVNYANKIHDEFSHEEKKVFEEILSSVITVSSTNEGIFIRKIAAKETIQSKSETHKKIVDHLTNKHLFVSGKNSEGLPTITLVHEILISKWDVIKNYIEKEKEFIKLNEYYETQANHWFVSSSSNELLISSKFALKESEYFLYSWEDKTSLKVKQFINSSIKRNLRKGFPLILSLCIVGVISILCALYLFIFNIDLLSQMYEIEYSKHDFIEAMPLFIQIISLSVYIVIVRLKAQPIYKRIKNSLFFWSAMSLLSIADIILTLTTVFNATDLFDKIFQSLWLLLPIFVFFKFVEKLKKYKEIKYGWTQRIKKPINKIKSLSKIGNTILISFITLIIVSGLALWGTALSDKQDKIDEAQTKLNEAHSMLFDLYEGLDRIENRLTSGDKIYINAQRKNFLLFNYKDSITEDKTGRYARYYAISQYNLCRPDYAYSYSGDDYWLQFLVSVDLDDRTYADSCLHWYLEDTPIEKINRSLPWEAEQIGDFSIAKKILQQCEEAGYVYLKEPSADLINYAHSLLMTDEGEKALSIYSKYLKSTFEDGRKWQDEMINDFAIFRWLGFKDNEINYIEDQLNLEPKKLYTSIRDTANNNLIQSITGEWQCVENGYNIDWEITIDNYNLCFYSVTDSLLNDVNRGVSRYRVTQRNNLIFIEEYNPRIGVISSGIINMPNENELIVKIIDNGVPEMRGIIRDYKRKLDDTDTK